MHVSEGESSIQGMFTRVASRYDLLNNLMSLGAHKRWRRAAVDMLRPNPGDLVVDVATGTGDMALLLAGRVGPDGRVVGVDFCPEMLAIARRKASAHPQGSICSFIEGDALGLDLPDDYADCATIVFGLRNLTDIAGGLGEMVRILKPGGKLLSLELSAPRPSWLQLYLMRAIPWLGRRFSFHPPAYEYLSASIFNHPPPEKIARLGKDAGLAAMDYYPLFGGLAVIHLGRKGS